VDLSGGAILAGIGKVGQEPNREDQSGSQMLLNFGCQCEEHQEVFGKLTQDSHEKGLWKGSFEADPPGIFRVLLFLSLLLPFRASVLVLNTTCPIFVGRDRAGIATRTQQN